MIDGIDCLITPGAIMRQLVWPTLAILLVASTLDAQTRTTAELPGTRTFGRRTAATPPLLPAKTKAP